MKYFRLVNFTNLTQGNLSKQARGETSKETRCFEINEVRNQKKIN